jgi:hypothetical protein
MKTLATAMTVVMLSATAALAENFENTTFAVEATSGALDVTVDANADGLTNVEVGVTAGVVRLALGTDLLDADTLTATAEYAVVMSVTDSLAAYGTAQVAYATTTDFQDGDWSMNPSVGLEFQVTNAVAVYGEVGYSWDVSTDMDRLGGYVEFGVPFAVTSAVTLTPSVARSFDTGTDNPTEARLVASLSF